MHTYYAHQLDLSTIGRSESSKKMSNLQKPSSCCWATFPPQVQSIDKGHGVIVERKLWVTQIDAKTLGIPGAVQIFRIDRKVETLRRGKVIKTTIESAYGMTSRLPDEASPEQLFQWVREYWWIEDKQHYRRDHTQREDHCQVRNTLAARNLSLFRSAAIFLFERQRSARNHKKSLPDWQRKNIRNPNALIKMLVG